ncbi:PAS domain S-box-containing protein [Stella humosa]|uniref:PAS domain S-box-containing protein n=1 Tax=Stella humosa TaxID=94 RepID=A0A3N1MAN9_9PROT|nr:HlyD family efflux transporter periplasmic adaptor subunit [Stella humosa]ROP99819.1 PAS domain S-box-containing protein [Stella humosa]BBK30953.1 hypothetical protein STHU_15870 [Stella humosa]
MVDQQTPRPGSEHALRVVESMTSGVVTLDAEGRVTAINQRAGQIIGMEADRLTGESLVALLLDDPANEALTDAIVEASYDVSGRYHREVEYHSNGRRRVLDLRANLLRGDGGTTEGVVLVIDDITETAILRASEQRLAEELRARNDNLTEAYRGLEEKTRSLDQAKRRVRSLGLIALGMAVFVVGGAAFYAWTAAQPPDIRRPTAAAGTAPSGFVVQPRPLRQTTSVTGTIEPGKVVEVTAPFAGEILARDFVYGSRVEQGQELVRLEGAEIERERRKSVVATMNARAKVDELLGWERGNEVQRARRQLAQNRQGLERAQQQLQTAADLLRRGIIAKQEHDSLQQQLSQSELQVFSSEQDLAATLRKGSSEQVTIARLDLASVEEKLADQVRQLAGARIIAPVSGVALRPRAAAASSGGEGGGSASRDIVVGSRVEQGRTLLEIGDLTSLSVRGQVDEIDVGRVRPGLPVVVQGVGFGGQPLAGEVAAVSSQANAAAGGRSARARFDVLVAIRNLPESARQALRIGMSATLEIVLYENRAALIVPPDLLRRTADGPRLMVRRGAQGEPQEVKPTLGVSLPQGIEVTAGLNPGDEIVRP